MTALSNINQTLNSTNDQLDDLSKELKQNPNDLKPRQVKALTQELTRAAASLAKELDSQKAPTFKAETVKNNLHIINQLKKSESLGSEFKNALSSYESQLKALKSLNKTDESGTQKEVKVKPVIRRDHDVGKHLNDVNEKLKSIIQQKDKVKAPQSKELTNILMKTNVALAKAVAFHNTIPNQYKPDYNARMIQTILNGINNLGNQAQIAQVSSQAAIIANFNMTVAEAKGLLEQVLDHLKESRGKRVSKVRSDRAKK